MGKNFLQEYLVFFTSIFFLVLDFKKKNPPLPTQSLKNYRVEDKSRSLKS